MKTHIQLTHDQIKFLICDLNDTNDIEHKDAIMTLAKGQLDDSSNAIAASIQKRTDIIKVLVESQWDTHVDQWLARPYFEIA